MHADTQTGEWGLGWVRVRVRVLRPETTCLARAGVVVQADTQTGERWERTRAQVDAAALTDTARAVDLAFDQEVRLTFRV